MCVSQNSFKYEVIFLLILNQDDDICRESDDVYTCWSGVWVEAEMGLRGPLFIDCCFDVFLFLQKDAKALPIHVVHNYSVIVCT